MMKETMDKKLEAIFKDPIPKKHVEVIRMQMVREGRSLYGAKKIMTPEDAVELVRPLFEMADREMVVVLSMNARAEPVAAEIAAIGSVDSCEICVQNIFKHSIVANACRLILIHNHPLGELRPSEKDVLITCRIGNAGDYIGILLMDHIIISEEGYYSFRESYGGGVFWSSKLDKKSHSDAPLWVGRY